MNAGQGWGRPGELVRNVLLSVTVFSLTVYRTLLRVKIILNPIYDPHYL